VTPPPPGVIAASVSIDGIDVSGLTPRDAEIKIAGQIVGPKRTPLVLVIRGRRVAIDPAAAGYRSFVARAVQGAMNVGRTQPPGPVDIPLTERVELGQLKRVLEWRSRGLRVAPRNAAVAYSGSGKVVIRRARAGVELDLDAALPKVQSALLSGDRRPLKLPLARVTAEVPKVPTTVFVDRGRFRLTLVRASGVMTFPIAVGKPGHSTPAGGFRIVDKQRNPTWYPPDSRWAEGLGPVAPGAGNPLGTRWMGISSPAIGIHGTPSPWSIGSRASHGCIRMYIRDAERLFELVEIGTPVNIV
jgi:lipoprotein-anchoring transpeptidase ErfK/SrfK